MRRSDSSKITVVDAAEKLVSCIEKELLKNKQSPREFWEGTEKGFLSNSEPLLIRRLCPKPTHTLPGGKGYRDKSSTPLSMYRKAIKGASENPILQGRMVMGKDSLLL